MQQNEKVKCDRFSFTYDGGNTFGVHDIDLTIQEGEFIVLTGSSGCGKTTLTRCINGLIPDFLRDRSAALAMYVAWIYLNMKPETIRLLLAACFKTRVHSFSRSM